MMRIYILIGAVFVVGLTSACDGNNSKKMLENKGNPFGQISDESTVKVSPEPKKDQKDDSDKAKPNGQPFGSLE